MCFGCSKKPSHGDGSFEYPQHMFWLRNKKNNVQLRTLIWGPPISLKGQLSLDKMKINNLSEAITICLILDFLG